MRLLPVLPSVLLSLLAASCSLQAKMVLLPEGGASIDADLRVSDQARTAWSSLRDLDSTLPADPFDAALLQKSLGSKGSVSTKNGSTMISLSVPALQRFLPGWKTSGDVWEAVIDRSVVRRWTALTAWGDSPALDSILPAPGTKVSEAEYRDLLLYLLGPGAASAQSLDTSTVQLTIVTPRPIKSAPGSLTVSGSTATYRWPLTRILTLETPITIKLTF